MSSDTCGHETSHGEPCQHPATDGDSCWLDEHGGNAAPSGRPTDLTEDLIDEACDLVADGTLIKDVWAMLDIGRTTWYRWRDEGREELEEHGEPQTKKGEFWARLMRAEAKAREKWHRVVRDGLITRKEVVRNGDGEVETVIPKRLDPETREEIVGEAPQTSNAMKYLKARWPDEFAERHEHTGKDGEPLDAGGVTVNMHPGLAPESEGDQEADGP